jgi:hypothetical protein
MRITTPKLAKCGRGLYWLWLCMYSWSQLEKIEKASEAFIGFGFGKFALATQTLAHGSRSFY